VRCRHGILITVLRPWYAFDCVSFAPVALQSITHETDVLDYEYVGEPKSAGGAGVNAVAETPTWGTTTTSPATVLHASARRGAGPVGVAGVACDDVALSVRSPCAGAGADADADQDAEHVIVIDDCKGTVTFDYGQAAHATDGVLEGEIRCLGLALPITRIVISLVRVEQRGVLRAAPSRQYLSAGTTSLTIAASSAADECTVSNVVFEETLLDPTAPPSEDSMPIEGALRNDVQPGCDVRTPVNCHCHLHTAICRRGFARRRAGL
jgi:hypothetical protein